jgi:hypothetical protein
MFALFWRNDRRLPARIGGMRGRFGKANLHRGFYCLSTILTKRRGCRNGVVKVENRIGKPHQRTVRARSCPFSAIQATKTIRLSSVERILWQIFAIDRCNWIPESDFQ